MKLIGPNLRAVRRDRGWTLKQLGDAVGLSISRLSHIEKGDEGTTIQKVRKLADALCCPVAALTSADFPLADILGAEAPV